MLTGIRIFTSDPYWRAIVTDLNAVLVDDANLADVDLDSLELHVPASPLELKSAIISALDDSKVLLAVFGRPVSLSPIQRRIVVRLKKTGGMTADELKLALGYARDTTTHTVDTAIYGLRKLFGRNFIVNENGIFKIGGV
ncbi:MAG: helix-turn-helix domain-containing protein [Alphaproteobacteria bacterium]|nr:helix-turn-helix domain-containing protein [Alphaproteobacteria bacterium]